MKALRILVADDHDIVRAGLRALLTEQPSWQLCGEAATGREAVAQAEQLQPDVAILDLTMADGDGLEATRQIRQRVPQCEVLILSVHESSQVAREIVAAGARGYVVKNDAGQELVQAIEAVSKHQPYFSPRVGYLLSREPETNAPTLTGREREIASLIAAGHSTKQIATRLGISPLTVETHRSNLMHKLGTRSVADLVRYAIREKLIEP